MNLCATVWFVSPFLFIKLLIVQCITQLLLSFHLQTDGVILHVKSPENFKDLLHRQEKQAVQALRVEVLMFQILWLINAEIEEFINMFLQLYACGVWRLWKLRFASIFVLLT